MDERMHPASGLPVAGDCPPSAYDRTPVYDRMIAEKDVAVPMRDGVKICVDIYRPDTTEKLPALLAFAIYNKDFQGPDVNQALPAQPAWTPLWSAVLPIAYALAWGADALFRDPPPVLRRSMAAIGLVMALAVLMGIALAGTVEWNWFPLTDHASLALTALVFAALLASFAPVTRSSR